MRPVADRKQASGKFHTDPISVSHLAYSGLCRNSVLWLLFLVSCPSCKSGATMLRLAATATLVAGLGMNLALADSSRPGLHKFYLHYLIVKNMKENDDQHAKVAEAFLQSSPKAAYSLGEFWWDWGLRDCYPYLHQYIEDASRGASKADQKKFGDQVEDLRDRCIQAFIFEHWDDINTSLANMVVNFPTDTQ